MVAEADEALDGEVLRGRHADAGRAGARASRTATRAGKIFPLVCTSALANIGAQPLLDAVLAYLPSPADRPFTAIGERRGRCRNRPTRRRRPRRSCGRRSPISSPAASRCSASIQGCLKADSTVVNATQGTPGAARPPDRAAGQDADQRAGDQGRRPRRGRQAEGHARPTTRSPTRRPASRSRRSHVSRAGAVVRHRAEEPRRRRQDQHGDAPARGRGPTIKYRRDPQTHELLLAGQGQMHIEVTVAKLKRRFGVEVLLKPPRIPYRETITARVEAHGRHKKQTGGHGQFGDCKIKMEPLPRGSEFEFVDEIFGGSIPRAVHPRGREGHPGIAAARLSWPATRWSTSASRSTTARTTTSIRTSCRSRPRAGSRSRTACRAPGRRCSSRS